MDIAELCASQAGGFGWIDYLVLAVVLGGSCAIGIFYAIVGPKQTTSEDFLLGGSSMGTVPTALSLAAGFVTAIELLGNPSEMYYHGSQFWMICLSFILVVPITSYLYLPVFRELQLTSSFQYLELRFNKYSRILAAAMYVIQMVLYTSVAVYAPALALSHVTGTNVYLAVTIVYIVCIIYASQGGMKSVIMTDTFQAFVLVISIIAVMAIGNSMLNGASNILETNAKTGRLEFFNMNPSPTVRHTFWSVVIGGTFYWATMFCANQASIQKYMSVETISQARRALWTASIGLILIFSINFYTGAIVYKQYQYCDPLKNKEITAADELLPSYVMKIQGHLIGIPGLFVSGIFAASLGTVASAMNSLAAVSMKDLLEGMCGINIPDNRGANISKWLSLFFGVLSFALIFIVERLGSVLEVALTFNGITGGITLGLFSLGMLFPWANSKGALSGGLVGLGLVCWMGFGAQVAAASGYNSSDFKPVSVANCSCNATQINNSMEAEELPMWLYRVSYLWYSAIGCLVTFIVGVIVSYISGMNNPAHINAQLISPPVKTLLDSLPTKLRDSLNLTVKTKEPTSVHTINKDVDRLKKGGLDNYGLNLENDIPISHSV
ncbi:sodium-coupled monocarboxylate transporter 1-like [Rhodnius prolixus]|uniref:sodium-coupled monocarboxylate transporter 1-like n=1 Tax=Rhodnius prolixus TaxID=13249 RepID=UPI003D189D73